MPDAILRHDWKPSAFGVRKLDLDFNLGEDETLVRARIELARQAPGPLVLQGAGLEILTLDLDGVKVSPGIEGEAYHFDTAPDHCQIETLTRLEPEKNLALEGLYRSGGTFCTQCEAEGFRKITLYPDRPDVMAPMRVRIEGGREWAPVLLSNGNPVGDGLLPKGRHFAVWDDPFPKSSYLFALVAGRLGHIESHFRTASGRDVRLRIYAAPQDLEKLDHAMMSLRRAMAWDEQVYGREYQLSVFNIVAIGDFNMGAMENTSLNVFNTKYVLAGEDTATDADLADVERVIAHEYFHNWSGNRVTCRDWFQLSLKEGFTVFRDQCFSADHFGGPMKRIQDVETLRRVQFPEDAGPTAHPIRPDSYIEINNFYTPTVYEKGAEVVRMARTILGDEAFRRGTDRYFSRYDGQAVTCEDFVAALEEAAGVDLGQFRRWYEQAGTPEITVETGHDPAARRFTLTLSQMTPPTPGQADKPPLHIPVRLGLIDRASGEALKIGALGGDEQVLHLKEARQSFTFENIAAPPVVSLLRGFSAPVKLKIAREPGDLVRLMTAESDPFARWDAAQQLGLSGLAAMLKGANAAPLDALTAALEQVLGEEGIHPQLAAAMIRLPDEILLSQSLDEVDAAAVHRVCGEARRRLAQRLRRPLLSYLRAAPPDAPVRFDRRAAAIRALRNSALGVLMAEADDEILDFACRQAREGRTMTERLGALRLIAEPETPARVELLEDFYQRYRDQPLVLDKWFAIQAAAHRPAILAEVRALMRHPDFTLANPNRLRALVGTYSAGNFPGFHQIDGAGYELLVDVVLKLDQFNPQIAARLIGPLRAWRRFAAPWGEAMAAALRRIGDAPGLSRDCGEVVAKSLA